MNGLCEFDLELVVTQTHKIIDMLHASALSSLNHTDAGGLLEKIGKKKDFERASAILTFNPLSQSQHEPFSR